MNSSIKMEVGIEDCLHIEFEYNRSKYHLKDVVIGKIYFLLVRLKIKHMEIEIRKRESTGSGSDLYNESETITKFEIMDGAPVRAESVPVRLFLSGFDLTPTVGPLPLARRLCCIFFDGVLTLHLSAVVRWCGVVVL